MAETIVVALGGNAIKSATEAGNYGQQLARVQESMEAVARLIALGYHVVITHGNGPQVGDILLQQEAAREQVPPMPMDVCGAESQGQIGYMIQQALGNSLRRRHLTRPVCTVLTQVVVSGDDPAFANPSKPVGLFYSASHAEAMRAKGYTVVEDAGRGYRRVVPSPQPRDIVEIKVIRALIQRSAIVVCSGGGGVPVLRDEQGQLTGVEAVIDKDLAGALLATQLEADRLLILTDVANAAINFRQPDQQDLGRITPAEARYYIEQSQFAKGSMLPKVLAAVRFAESAPGRSAHITRIENALAALKGEAGTMVIAE
jgi:carbamate kinase